MHNNTATVPRASSAPEKKEAPREDGAINSEPKQSDVNCATSEALGLPLSEHDARARTEAGDARFARLKAKLKERRFDVIVTDVNGVQCLLITRWGHIRQVADVGAAERFLEQVGGSAS